MHWTSMYNKYVAGYGHYSLVSNFVSYVCSKQTCKLRFYILCIGRGRDADHLCPYAKYGIVVMCTSIHWLKVGAERRKNYLIVTIGTKSIQS